MKQTRDPTGATISFEFDRMTVERFRRTFPRARWDDEKMAWFVPGKTAQQRIARWHALEQSKADVYADAKGRDAFLFDPLHSRYIEAAAELLIRTPYSRTVVEELRQVPFARWDGVRRVWLVPFRSYEELKRRWPTIEAAARRNEPEEHRRRLAERRGSEAWIAAGQRAAERRKHRYPLPSDELPPLHRPVSTASYGIVVFTGSVGELVEHGAAARHYHHVSKDRSWIWADWRSPRLRELVESWPARTGPSTIERERGWWQPTKPELVEARRKARARERKRGEATF